MPLTANAGQGDPQDIHDGKRTGLVVVRLAGGPLHGDWKRVRPDQLSRFAISEPLPGTAGCERIACYVPSDDEPGVYVFARLEFNPYPGVAPGGASLLRPRVYELAHELGVESKDVMIRLQEMGEFVRSAASTVELVVARKLREQFGALTARSKD